MNEPKYPEAVTVPAFARLLGEGVTEENVHARIQRGSLAAHQDETGEWFVPRAELDRIRAEIEPCQNCGEPSNSYVIVKYHDHERVEFALCDVCASAAQMAYSRKGGVLEVVTYPVLGEGWLKPGA